MSIAIIMTIIKYFFFIIVFVNIGCTLNLTISSLNPPGLDQNNSDGTIATPSQLACDSSITNAYGGGDGSSAKPFTLCSLSHWSYFADDSASWGLNFKLYSDLDFTGVIAADFKSIGNTTLAFTGSFDGNGFKIMNLDLTESMTTLAIFKKTDMTAKFTNLTLENISLKTNARMAGLVLDHGNGGMISFDNITISNLTISPLGGSNISYVGGLVGNSEGTIEIKNITINKIHFTSSVSGICRYWGGLIGGASETLTIEQVSGNSIIYDGFAYGDSAGIAGKVMASSNFQKINLTGLNIISSNGNASGLISISDSDVNINQVHLVGSVSGVTRGGGVISYSSNSGTPSNITIVDSSYEGPVLAAESGGLIALSFENNITITRSYFKGSMLGVWNGTAGGLISQSQGVSANIIINDSYAISDMSNSTVNWLIAGLVSMADGNVILSRSYYSGTLSGISPKACIADNVSSASFITSDTYYDSTLCTASANKTGAIAGATGLSTASLQTSTPFTNWLPTVWKFTSSKYPKLIWEPDVSSFDSK